MHFGSVVAGKQQQGGSMSVDPQQQSRIEQLRAILLTLLTSISATGYAILLWLSKDFSIDTPADEKPTVWMLAVFGCLFVVYWFAIWLAVRMTPSRWLTAGILAAACVFRGILLPSTPILEIDIYRYIWDGTVLTEGISPYQYTPQQVLDAVNAGGAPNDATLQGLVELQAGSGSLNESLNRIHFEHFPSPYPLVSQAVFALSATITPDSATIQTRLVTMKALLVAFDLATLAVVMLLLREVGLHAGWSITYGWCPLVMKEFANGGHLDSIAIFFTTLSIWLLVHTTNSKSERMPKPILPAAVLALAIGAKLYPVVLVPLFAAVWLRRRGWQAAGGGMATTTLVSAVLLYPLLGFDSSESADRALLSGEQAYVDPGQVSEPTLQGPKPVDADAGIKAFLSQWEMNDLIFMLVLENLRPQSEVLPERQPWFVVSSDEWVKRVVTGWARLTRQVDREPPVEQAAVAITPAEFKRASFSLARAITGVAFGLLACWLAWRAAGSENPHDWCRAAMLTLAWFWLTCPTQNPWYWCWVMPLLPFARYRAWYAVAALTMLYYLRFWLMAHFDKSTVLGTPYNGAYFFYFVIAWIEFLPVFVALAWESVSAKIAEMRTARGNALPR